MAAKGPGKAPVQHKQDIARRGKTVNRAFTRSRGFETGYRGANPKHRGGKRRSEAAPCPRSWEQAHASELFGAERSEARRAGAVKDRRDFPCRDPAVGRASHHELLDAEKAFCRVSPVSPPPAATLLPRGFTAPSWRAGAAPADTLRGSCFNSACVTACFQGGEGNNKGCHYLELCSLL